MKKSLIILALLLLPASLGAQELHQDLQGVWRAEVIEASASRNVEVIGTDAVGEVQDLKALLLEGEREGEIIEFENDYIQLKEGDKFYLNYIITIDGLELYSVRELDRRTSMFALFAIFVLTILFFGGFQGFKSLLSLFAGLLVIVYVLIPQLVSGVSPVPLSIAVSSLVLFFAIFFTHGFNKRSFVAYLGTIIAVVITGLFAYVSINSAGLTGFSSDESIYLDLGTGGQLDFVGLLLASMIIGALGVLDDIAVTQVAVVRELFGSGNKDKKDVYKRAMRVGREHVGALVNTLVLAYTASALPLLLLFSLSDSSALSIINREIFATEILRSLVGSIGLILTVPITTLLAVTSLSKYTGDKHEKGHGHIH